jgi:tRNA G18 (ribose-2'-O)-methylase SpoU
MTCRTPSARPYALAELPMPESAGVAALEGAGGTAVRITRLLALDGIQDPGNLGTLVGPF